MKLFNICTRKDFDKEGIRKSVWYKVGLLKEADSGRMYIKMYHQPSTEFFVFEKDENVALGDGQENS
jgi:hypothetical protein